MIKDSSMPENISMENETEVLRCLISSYYYKLIENLVDRYGISVSQMTTDMFHPS